MPTLLSEELIEELISYKRVWKMHIGRRLGDSCKSPSVQFQLSRPTFTCSVDVIFWPPGSSTLQRDNENESSRLHEIWRPGRASARRPPAAAASCRRGISQGHMLQRKSSRLHDQERQHPHGKGKKGVAEK